MRALALNTGPDFHLLDHIAPLAEKLAISLAVTEELNYNLAKRYYPQIEVQYFPYLEHSLKDLCEKYDTLFECKYFKPHLKNLFWDLYRKEMRLIFCPHGQSDKGFGFPTLAPYQTQDIVLIYGKLLLEMLKQLKIPIKSHIVIGNYRLEFYQKYQSFYDEIVSSFFPASKKTILFAPTWKDADQNDSFFTHTRKVVEQLPKDWHLIVKVHPLLEQRNPAEYYRALRLIDKKSNITLIDQVPLIYPILKKIDAYLGDFSSVGYDSLYFNIPLFFLPSRSPSRLYECGTTLDLSQNIYKQMESAKDYSKQQTKLYDCAFEKNPKNLSTLLAGE